MKASSHELTAFSAGVSSVLSNCHSLEESVAAISHLIPSKYIRKSISTKEETSEFDNLNSKSFEELQEMYKKKRKIDTLKSRYNHPFDEDSDEEPLEPKSEVRRSKRHKDPRVAALQCMSSEDLLAHHEIVCNLSEQRARSCHRCHSSSHQWRQCPYLANGDGSRKPFCVYCKGEHDVSSCPTLLTVKCDLCKGSGHTRRFCQRQNRGSKNVN